MLTPWSWLRSRTLQKVSLNGEYQYRQISSLRISAETLTIQDISHDRVIVEIAIFLNDLHIQGQLIGHS